MQMKQTTLWRRIALLVVSVLLLIGSAHARQDAALGENKPDTKVVSQESKRAKGPYIIYKGNNTEMTLLWQGTKSFKSTIKWGKDTTYSLGSNETIEYGDHQHSYTIKNLESGAKYYYEVAMDGETFSGSFRAAPSEAETKLKFLVYGDTRSHPDVHNRVADAMLSAYAADDAFQTLVVNVGDLVKYGDVESQWKEQFFDAKYPKIQKLLAHVSYQTTVGNHELYGMNYSSIDPTFKRFKKYFPYPFVEHAYWSFDYGPAHFVMVDQYYYEYDNYRLGKLKQTFIQRERVVRSYEKKIRKLRKRDSEKDRKKAEKIQKKRDKTLARLTEIKTEMASLEQQIGEARKIQLTWLEDDLASTGKPWKFIVLHEPGWSAGGGHKNNEEVQEFIQPLAEKYGVSAVFNGHNHYYARAVVNNVQHVTAGGGGAPAFHGGKTRWNSDRQLFDSALRTARGQPRHNDPRRKQALNRRGEAYSRSNAVLTDKSSSKQVYPWTCY
jgi:hypothetical protein